MLELQTSFKLEVSFFTSGLFAANQIHQVKLSELSFVFFFCLFRAAPAAYGGSQARSPIRAVAVALHHSRSNTGSTPHLQPTPQLKATPDP